MDCIFCKIVAGEIPAYKVYEDDDVLAFLDQRVVQTSPLKHVFQFCRSLMCWFREHLHN